MLLKLLRNILEVMMMNRSSISWKLLLLAAVLPILVLVTISISLGGKYPPEAFKRFGNALLTSYVSVLVGIGISWALVSYQDLLLEANSGLRAQVLSNIVHFLVSGTAMMLAAILTIGSTFAVITSRPRRLLFKEEE